MFDFFGSELPLAARFFIAFLVVLALIGLTAWVVRRFGANRLGGANARGRQPRLAVIDAASVDGRRRLVLIRRDNVEHLLMIGGPTDVVVEPNIVRAAGAREPARPGAETTAWPLQPVSEPPPVAPPRSYRGLERAPIPEEQHEELPGAQAPEPPSYRAPPSEEPWLPTTPGVRPRSADSLTGLASELSSKLTPPEPEAPPVERREPRFAAPTAAAPEPVPAPSVDHNLSDMAQQLEAALRRAPLPEGRPPVTDPLATQPHMPMTAPAAAPMTAREVKPPVPKPAPRAEPWPSSRIEPKAEVKAEPKVEPKIEPRVEPKFETKTEPVKETKPDVKPEPKTDAAAASNKNLYDNLEEEMASLLGRPMNKS